MGSRGQARIRLLIVILGIAGSPGCGSSDDKIPYPTGDPPQVADLPASRLVGTPGCSGRGCHADFDRGDPKQPISSCSYSLWLDDDPHVNAYRALFTPRAREMGKRMGVNVTEEPRCLACHVTPWTAGTPTPANRQEREFGVGCESCHGRARDWLVPHRDAAWQKLDAEAKRKEYARYGMNELQNLPVRAAVCAGCHVGAPANDRDEMPLRDMDHEMIAAGHPRLAFEFNAFQANLPRHWKEKNAGPDFLARSWLVGQVVSARVALDLLADRSAGSNAERPWPEFSEQDCYACHHGLVSDGWRQGPGFPQKGRARMSRWYVGLVPLVESFAGIGKSRTPLLGLEKAMDGVVPRRTDVLRQARTSRASLGGLASKLNGMTLDEPGLVRLRNLLARQGARQVGGDWDETEQLALGLKAVFASERALRKTPRPRDENLARVLDGLLEKLAFKGDQDGPPRASQRADHLREIRDVFQKLGD